MTENVQFYLNYEISSQFVNEKRLEFFKNRNTDLATTSIELTTHESRWTITQICVKAMRALLPTETPVVYNADYKVDIITPSAMIEFYHNSINLWQAVTINLKITIMGIEPILRQMETFLMQNIEIIHTPVVTWEFMAGAQRRSQVVNFEPAKPIYKEFYPWINIDTSITEYFDRFLASDASVLILLGETGTAKTSFIRSMIWHANLRAMFTYDEELLRSDTMFIDMLINDQIKLLVIEDADLFLTDRVMSGNRVMSKFLNITDGLASGNGRKKVIFTANIMESNKIDSALLRPGRCYDCMMFRRLTYPEACAAAKVANIPIPTIEKDYTLAELFANSGERHVTRRIGFTAK